MRLFYSVIFAITILSMTSCYPKRAFYTVELQTVESPTNAKQQFGQTKVVNFSNVGGNKNVFEDEFINISWNVKSETLDFELTNKSNHTMKINWDDVSYVDYKGEVKRVIHANTKYIDKENAQVSLSIPKGAKLSDLFFPSEKAEFVRYRSKYQSYDYWTKKTLIPSVYKKKKEREEKAPMYTGKTMSVLLPIMIEGVQNDYYFTFEIGTWRSRE